MKRNLVRTRQNGMVHLASCHMAQRGAALPWDWADRQSAIVVLAALNEGERADGQAGLRSCRRCQPMTAVRRELQVR